jgi:hypothetical protein
MRYFALSIVAASLATMASLALTPVQSQAQPAAAPAPCGPVAYSAADQKYVGVPCSAPAPSTDASGKSPCGPVAYSAADQRYTGVPCTAPAQKAEAGKPAPCGAVAYSNADQRYVGVPCPTAK